MSFLFLRNFREKNLALTNWQYNNNHICKFSKLMCLKIYFINRKIYNCSGNETKYTNDDCESEGAKHKKAVDGCYASEGLNKYKSCAPICNGKVVDSSDAALCKADCLGT